MLLNLLIMCKYNSRTIMIWFFTICFDTAYRWLCLLKSGWPTGCIDCVFGWVNSHVFWGAENTKASLNLTTKGDSSIFLSCKFKALLYNVEDEIGATNAEYLHGIEIPLGFKSLCAPSKHSGESSLSPKEPSSSETRISHF